MQNTCEIALASSNDNELKYSWSISRGIQAGKNLCISRKFLGGSVFHRTQIETQTALSRVILLLLD